MKSFKKGMEIVIALKQISNQGFQPLMLMGLGKLVEALFYPLHDQWYHFCYRRILCSGVNKSCKVFLRDE